MPPRFAEAPVIETSRLVLGGHGLADWDEMFALWSDAAVTRFIGGKPSTEEEAWARLLRYAGHWRLLGYGFWSVREKATGAYVGAVGFMDARRPLPDDFRRSPEVGWALGPAFQGRGYATESVAAALAWGDTTFEWPRTVCIIDPINTPSLAVAARCGFAEFGRADYHGETIMLQRYRP